MISKLIPLVFLTQGSLALVLSAEPITVAEIYLPQSKRVELYRIDRDQLNSPKLKHGLVAFAIRKRLMQEVLKLQSWIGIPLGGLENYILENVSELSTGVCNFDLLISVDLSHCRLSHAPTQCLELKRILPSSLHMITFEVKKNQCHLKGLRTALMGKVERQELKKVWQTFFESRTPGLGRQLKQSSNRIQQQHVYRDAFRRVLSELLLGVEVVSPVLSLNSTQIVDFLMQDSGWSESILIERFFERE